MPRARSRSRLSRNRLNASNLSDPLKRPLPTHQRTSCGLERRVRSGQAAFLTRQLKAAGQLTTQLRTLGGTAPLRPSLSFNHTERVPKSGHRNDHCHTTAKSDNPERRLRKRESAQLPYQRPGGTNTGNVAAFRAHPRNQLIELIVVEDWVLGKGTRDTALIWTQRRDEVRNALH